ncbi:NADH-quinone oxidoreductase subunit J [Marinoscillum sp. MHG1-6]|uniref:NADH-quinone oxidoreductase subunit J family protein n=1 Tax=Marinoscillum sp. MHG1-6 TaxID=2959627 RepID=UPI002157AC1A|nr:NADH-quinone oxidoreductase subunit J [Marinoscillum sp. MHG1-6]
MTLNILFFAFAAMIVVPLIYLLITKNIIRAAFAFAISLLGMAAIYVLLNAEFMAVVQILIYAGGIVVLLIFGVMLTKRSGDEGVFTAHHQVIPGVLVSLAFFVLLTQSIFDVNLAWGEEVTSTDQVKQIGVLYLTDHLIAFELIAFLLLMALVGAAFLAKKSDQ